MTFVFSHRPPQDRPPVCIGVPIDYEHCLHDIHVLAFSIDFEIRLQYGIVQEDFRTISTNTNFGALQAPGNACGLADT
jgi:hypothetical protein